MTWCFDDERSVATDSLAESLESHQAIVPAHWPAEVANTLAGAERRARISELASARFLRFLVGLPIHVDGEPRDVGSLLATARRHNLTAYDAAYLELAIRLGAPLATLDRRLAQACVAAGVELLLT